MRVMQALGGDVVQTVTVRWRRMCEDLQFQQQQKQLTGTWCQPQRVQLVVKGWMFHLCAYHFPEETEQVYLTPGTANNFNVCSYAGYV